MIFKKWSMICFSFTAMLGFFVEKEALAAGNYETYLESWDSNWQNVVQNLPSGPGGTSANSYENVTLNVSFASYNFKTAPALSGLEFSKPSGLSTVVNFVHSHGGKVRISFGGATHAFFTTVLCPVSVYCIVVYDFLRW